MRAGPALAVLLLAACQQGPPADKPGAEPRVVSGSGAVQRPSVAALLAELRAKPGVVLRGRGGWTIVEDRAEASVWSFTPPTDAAYPAAIRRKLVPQGSALNLRTDVLCEAARPVCETFAARVDEQNELVREGLARVEQGRGQGHDTRPFQRPGRPARPAFNT